jgi:hypothetical protein
MSYRSGMPANFDHYYDPPESPEVITLKRRRIKKARKQHVCECCPAPIEPGQPYSMNVFLVDGKLEIFKRHAPGGCSSPYHEAEE